MGRQSYFITHLVNMFNVDDVIRRNNAFIKKRFFERVIDRILENIIGSFYGSGQGYPDRRFFYLTSPLLLGDFRKSSPVPFFTLKEGVPPLSPKSPFPSGYRGLNR